jgi:hypothetical protein
VILAIQVEVNGKPVTVAGASDLLTLVAAVGVGFLQDGVRVERPKGYLHVSGLAAEGPQDLRWVENHLLKTGDSVTFRIVEVERPSPPVRSVRSPSSAELKAAADRERSKKGIRARKR